jgi:hypothetical protein
MKNIAAKDIEIKKNCNKKKRWRCTNRNIKKISQKLKMQKL